MTVLFLAKRRLDLSRGVFLRLSAPTASRKVWYGPIKFQIRSFGLVTVQTPASTDLTGRG